MFYCSFLEFADPKVTVKHSSTFRRRKCQLLHDSVKKAVEDVLQKDLPEVTGVGFTTDGWTSRQNDPYQSLTLHYINKDFELKRFVLIYVVHITPWDRCYDFKNIFGEKNGAF
jgi:hypothetical protein